MFKDRYFQSSEIPQNAVKCIDYVEMEVDVESHPDIDSISDWDSFYNFCKKFFFTIDNVKERITLLKLEKNPWKIVYNIHISKEFQVFCMKGNTIVPG